jgi:putative sterol carrier protein
VIETLDDAVDRVEEAFWGHYESNEDLRDSLSGKDRTIVVAPSHGEARHVLVEDGEIVGTGVGDRDADVRVEGSTEDILAVIRGELSPLKAYFTGRVSVSASMRDLLLVKSFL